MSSTVNVSASERDRPSDDVFCFPASFAQQRLWFLHQLAPENPFYNVAAAIRFTGTLQVDALEQTFNAIVQRHEALRTTFMWVDGELIQVITPHLRVALPVIALHTPAEQRDEVGQQWAIEAFQRPFNLTVGPLIRVTLLQFDETHYVLLLNLHHIVADGWSIGVLIQELGALYTAFVANMPSPLVELPIQYADFACWQREYLQGEVLESQLSYWRQQLMDLPGLTLPTDSPRPAVQSYRGASQHLELTPTLTAALETLSQQTGTTLFMTLLAAFQTLLHRYTGQDDVAVGSPIANRNRSELEGLIGFFVNSLVLRTNLSGNPTFRALLRQVQTTTLAAYAHQDLPFEKLVEALQPARDFSRNPLFQIVFALQNAPIAPLQLPGLTLSPLNFDSGTTRFDLEFHCFKALDALHCTMIYSTDLFEPATIDRMLQHFRVLLEGIVANPDQPIADLPLLTAEEIHQRLVTWNNTALDCAQACIHQRVEAQAAQTPDAIAVVANQSLTYRELNQRANQLAHHLQQRGVAPETIVGLCVDRSPDLMIGILGIWKAGGAYLPLDPTYPSDRLDFMLKDAQVDLLVTQRVYRDQFGDRVPIVCLDQNWTDQYKPANPVNHVKANHLAYVIYTSGSTGKPKGVLVEHRGLINLVEAQQVFNLHPSNRILQFASLSFDASIFELVMALANGAALYMAPKEALLPGATLLQFLRDNAITHATLPPAVLALLPSAPLPALQTIIAAGEACSTTVVDRWANHQLFNAYGPTETTIWATVAQLQLGDKPTIGHPIANTQVYLLDTHLQPVPIGVTGELYIGGAGIARGYLNRPELTTERFIDNPFRKPGVRLPRASADGSQESGVGNGETNPTPRTLHPTPRLYKTGDLARYRADGSLEFLGRMDRQVKLRGYRIEPGEIETVLHQHPGIQSAVVTVREGKLGARLVAYLLFKQEQSVTTDDLHRFLRSQLPNYLMPSAFVQLKTLPLTTNGKIDYAALPSSQNNLKRTLFVAPRTAVEATLVSLWGQLLQREPIGIYDSFFDLGGDSLLAVRLMDQIQQQFAQTLPLSSLLLNPTIAGLSIVLNNNQSLHWSPLVPLQPKGSKPPFFCVHPIFGVVFPYYALAQQMGLDQPFYGLQPIGIDGQQPHTRIEEMAAYYIKAIRQLQPQGPYYLGGWSFGGLVAFEMAQQLRQAGQKVALLAVLDTLAPIRSNKPSFWKSFKFLLTTAARSIWAFLLDYLALLATTANQCNPTGRTKLHQTWQMLLERAAIASLLPQESQARVLDELTIRPMLRVFYANSQAVHHYVPQPYLDRITLFRTSTPSANGTSDPTLGWHQLAEADVKIHQIPGNHFTMLRKPQVEQLAQQLQICIETLTDDRRPTI